MKKIVAVLICILALAAFLAYGAFAGDEKPVKPEKPAKCEPAPAQDGKKCCDQQKPGCDHQKPGCDQQKSGCDPTKCQHHAKGDTQTKGQGHAGCAKPCAPTKDAGAAAAPDSKAAPNQTGTTNKSK